MCLAPSYFYELYCYWHYYFDSELQDFTVQQGRLQFCLHTSSLIFETGSLPGHEAYLLPGLASEPQDTLSAPQYQSYGHTTASF